MAPGRGRFAQVLPASQELADSQSCCPNLSSNPKRIWFIPEPIASFELDLGGGATILLRRHGNPDGPRILLCHGNGLASDMYYPFWTLLEDEFDLVVYDLRNHGRNPVGDLADHNIPNMVADHDRVLEAVAANFGEKPAIGLYHSVSALIALLSPALGAAYQALVLIDPPITKAGRDYEEFEAAANRAAAMARRRADDIPTKIKMIEVLSVIPLYQRMVPGVYQLIADTTLRPNRSREGFTLRCPKEYEARIMEYACAFAVAVDLEAIKCPIQVIGADPTIPYSYLPSLDLSAIARVNYDFIPDATHFLQLEEPQECLAMMRDFLSKIGALVRD